MMPDLNKFLLSLTALVAQRSNLAFATAAVTDRRSLFCHAIDDKLALDPHTKLVIYGGPITPGVIPYPTVSVQMWTEGTSQPLTLAQAMAVHQALLDDDMKPVFALAIAGKRFSATTGLIEDDPDQDWMIRQTTPLARPATMGRDQNSRWAWSCNWDIEFYSKAKTA